MHVLNIDENFSGFFSSSGSRLNSIIITVMVINVNPEYLSNLKEPISLRFEHLEVMRFSLFLFFLSYDLLYQRAQDIILFLSSLQKNVTKPKCSFLINSAL